MIKFQNPIRNNPMYSFRIHFDVNYLNMWTIENRVVLQLTFPVNPSPHQQPLPFQLTRVLIMTACKCGLSLLASSFFSDRWGYSHGPQRGKVHDFHIISRWNHHGTGLELSNSGRFFTSHREETLTGGYCVLSDDYVPDACIWLSVIVPYSYNIRNISSILCDEIGL